MVAYPSPWKVHLRPKLSPRLSFSTTIHRSFTSLNEEIVPLVENPEVDQTLEESTMAASNLDHTEILSAVLNELESERSQRMHLEEQVHTLRTEQAKILNVLASQQTMTTTRNMVSLQTERDGYRELIDALTAENKAIAAARTASRTTLPLHVVRLLEIMPWDMRANNHATATEEVYEWQVYKNGTWCGLIQNFPKFFKTLPIVQPQPRDKMQEGARWPFFESPPKQCVLTDDDITQLIKIDDGYPLPVDGASWQWIGGWRVNTRILIKNPSLMRKRIDCDEDGWSYTDNPMNFVTSPTDLCWDHPDNELICRIFRRREWTRRRALVDYPFASERTQHYLALLAENSRLSMSTSKLSDQLVETKMQLTRSEDSHMQTQEKALFLTEKLMSRENELSRVMEFPVTEASVPSNKTNVGETIGRQPIGKDMIRNLVASFVPKRPQSLEETIFVLTDDDQASSQVVEYISSFQDGDIASTTSDESVRSSSDQNMDPGMVKHPSLLDHLRRNRPFFPKRFLSVANRGDLTSSFSEELIT